MAANCLKLFFSMHIFAGPVYTGVLSALGQDGEKSFYHSYVLKSIKLARGAFSVSAILMSIFVFLCYCAGTERV